MSKASSGFGIDPNKTYNIIAEYKKPIAGDSRILGSSVGDVFPQVTFAGTLKLIMRVMKENNLLTAGEDEISPTLIDKILDISSQLKYTTGSDGSVTIHYIADSVTIKARENDDIEPITVGESDE